MSDELLLVISLAVSFGALTGALRLFGRSGVYVWIAVCSILANIEVTILVRAFGMEQTLGNTLFASSFLATDILSELYGKKSADRGVWIGIFTTVIFILFSNMWIRYTPSENDLAMPAVIALFSSTPRILAASLVGYAVSELLDVRLYHAWWSLTERKSGSRRRFLWFRNNFSTLISQLVNIVLFNFGAFFGVYDIRTLVSVTLAGYVIYVFTSLLDTPFVYLARSMHFGALSEDADTGL